ncbi:MAG: VIT family protein [Candidatus Saccharibacteria bacterium]|nr:VIT family protein [Candidatus Saccharibacteria bacterium]
MSKKEIINEPIASNQSLNRLRAAVLGANDGIVSISALLMGVTAATNNTSHIFTAGLAALVSGALSMAVGEYVSVSSQSDTEASLINKEKARLTANPKAEIINLAHAYVDMGLSKPTALQVAKELTKHDVLKAHLQVKHGIDEADLSSPMQAAIASFIAFAAGGALPFIIAIVTPHILRELAIVIAVTAALAITGFLSAKAGDAPRLRAIMRIIIGGLIAMGVTYTVGALFGTII